ncbi:MULTISPECIES: helix-turn-helix domain-containing protein [unclassified Leisingera]|uniref:helix-turn-helix domain-containing protein n=1 Tax=unclassified Leisingera TaxID=2614906 RepID=UPI001FFC4CE5|nr:MULTISPECIES: helix-turn-helix domain-containing protein [unclassified Leisingera]
MAHRELNLRERRAVEDMLNAKTPVREIAAEIGRHVSTVYRDIKPNGYALLKSRLAATFPDDRQKYAAGKANFIKGVPSGKTH